MYIMLKSELPNPNYEHSKQNDQFKKWFVKNYKYDYFISNSIKILFSINLVKLPKKQSYFFKCVIGK